MFPDMNIVFPSLQFSVSVMSRTDVISLAVTNGNTRTREDIKVSRTDYQTLSQQSRSAFAIFA